ncbi:hydroxylysine kinase-like [Ruditapes philippinarum]|uniref:hydroxylysine kinase-like n=1 Tax=Ruditapes philippinarum TaxID=129788 RepID=UPI00295A7A7E|nr:hydroxylysine kinase-like [Ruditapes philippinarum]
MSENITSNNLYTSKSRQEDDVKPRVSEKCLPTLLERLYGLKVIEIKKLPSYYDQNFFIAAGSNNEGKHVQKVNKDGYVLKILNKTESLQPDNIGSQHALCKYLREHGIPTQIPILNTEGQEWSLETFTDIVEGKYIKTGPYLTRLLTFVPGKVFVDSPYVPGSFFNIGRFVGRLHTKMKGFNHNFSDNHTNIWSLHQTPSLKQFQDVLPCEADITVIKEVVEAFEQYVLPKYDTFTKGVIHGDLNEQNIIVNEVPGQHDIPTDQRIHDVSAVIDFCFISYSYIVFDIAICIAYISIECPDESQADVGGHFLSGYYKTCSLNSDEFEALKILICARLCQSLVYGAHTYAQQPGNDYILSTQKRGWPLLHKLWKMSTEHLYSKWKVIMSEY